MKRTNRFLDALVGDYQIAFVGTIVSLLLQVSNTNFRRHEAHQVGHEQRTGDGLPLGRLARGLHLVPRLLAVHPYQSSKPRGAGRFLELPARDLRQQHLTVLLRNGQQVTTEYSPGQLA